MQLLCYWFAFRSFCFAADLNYSVIRVDPGAAVDSPSDKGKELLCHLIFVSNTIQRRQYFSWHTSVSWEKHNWLNFTHRKQFLDRKLCQISTRRWQTSADSSKFAELVML